MTRPSRSCRSEPQGLDLPGPEHGSSSFHLAHFPFRWCRQNDPRLRAEGVRQTSFPFAPYLGSQGSKGIVSSASSSSVAAFERFGVGRAPEPIPPLNSTAYLESVSSAYASYAKSRNDAALAQRDCQKRLFSWFSSVTLRPQLSGQPTIPTASGKFMQACRKDTLSGAVSATISCIYTPNRFSVSRSRSRSSAVYSSSTPRSFKKASTSVRVCKPSRRRN